MLTFNCRKQGWLEAQRGLEGGNTGGRGCEAVMRILDPRELFAPGGLVGGGHTSQGRFELLVRTLCLTIRLRVKAGGETDLSPKVEQNSLQTREVNCGPLSDTTSVGIPWRRKTWVVRSGR